MCVRLEEEHTTVVILMDTMCTVEGVAERNQRDQVIIQAVVYVIPQNHNQNRNHMYAPLAEERTTVVIHMAIMYTVVAVAERNQRDRVMIQAVVHAIPQNPNHIDAPLAEERTTVVILMVIM